MNNFSFKKIDEMSGREVYCVARLRDETFVAEQKNYVTRFRRSGSGCNSGLSTK